MPLFDPYDQYDNPYFGRRFMDDGGGPAFGGPKGKLKFSQSGGLGGQPQDYSPHNAEYTSGEDYATVTGDQPPPYPGPDGTEDEKHAWKQWVQRKEAWTQDELAGGHMVRMKKSDWNMRNAYGDTFANIDVLGHRVWDTRTYTDPVTGKEVKGGRWVAMDPQTQQDVNAWQHRFFDTPEGQAMTNAWGGNTYLGAKALGNVQRYQGAIDPRFNVYWNRGSAQLGDYGNYQFWDKFGRPVAMPKGWTPPNTGGMDPNHYELNTQNGAVYPNPSNNNFYNPYAAYGQTQQTQQSSTPPPSNTSAASTSVPPPSGNSAVASPSGAAWGITTSPVSATSKPITQPGIVTQQPQIPGMQAQQPRKPRYSPFRLDDRAYGA